MFLPNARSPRTSSARRALLLASLLLSASASAGESRLSVAPGGNYAYWCRTPLHYWLTHSWKIPLRLIAGETGPDGTLMDQKCVLGRKDGAVLFDGVGCYGKWSEEGTRWVEACPDSPLTLYLLPERKKIEIGGRFFAWAERDPAMMFSAAVADPETDRIEIVKLALPSAQPQRIFLSTQTFDFGGGQVQNLKVCADRLKIMFEYKTTDFPERPLSVQEVANGLGVMTYDVVRGALIGVASYPLNNETYRKLDVDLCAAGG